MSSVKLACAVYAAILCGCVGIYNHVDVDARDDFDIRRTLRDVTPSFRLGPVESGPATDQPDGDSHDPVPR